MRLLGDSGIWELFIPGLGALIRLQQQIVNPREDADIGLAGPIYGLGAAAVSLGLWYCTEQPIFAAIAGVGAWINLFNLLPLGSLDGGRQTLRHEEPRVGHGLHAPPQRQTGEAGEIEVYPRHVDATRRPRRGRPVEKEPGTDA